ncbi:thioesterase domain-containing protein [Lentzea sp. NPDC004782]|uniref:thioesterase domain-containing protein n=1 Tax=Lentzea sp. NPDC004782 TaxID=3154458 RepID=UPI0033B90006
MLSLVRECAARVLDAEELIAPDMTFREYGFDSAASERLRDEIAECINLRLLASIAFDHPTPRELAQHLTVVVNGALPRGFEQIYRQLCRKNPGAAEEMVRAASVLRPVFTEAETIPPRTIKLASGPGPLAVMCFSSMLPMTTPAKFTEFAEAFAGFADVHGIAHPGFAEGQRVPADVDALVAAHIATVTELVKDRPYVLCGYSSGGWIAHLIAERLGAGSAAVRRGLKGLVLLDSSWPSTRFAPGKAGKALAASVRREEARGIDEAGMTRLTAMGAYLRLLDGWAPAQVGIPVLHVAAEVHGATWQLPHVAATTPGGHLTMLPAAGHVVVAWLRDLEARIGSGGG